MVQLSFPPVLFLHGVYQAVERSFLLQLRQQLADQPGRKPPAREWDLLRYNVLSASLF